LAAIALERTAWAVTVGDSVEVEGTVDWAWVQIDQERDPKKAFTFRAVCLVFAVKIVHMRSHLFFCTLDELITNPAPWRKRWI
jgi:hypothetical protein